MTPEPEAFEVAVRAYAVPQKIRPRRRRRAGRRLVANLAASAWTLTFDTEFRGIGQQLTIGTYQVRETGALREAGLVVDSGSLTETELATLGAFAVERGLVVRELADFIDAVFYPILVDLHGTCIGFNLPLDLSRLAIHHDVAHSPTMRGGFTFQLSSDRRRGWLQVRHLNSHAAFIRFAAPDTQPTPRSMRRRGLVVPTERGHFVMSTPPLPRSSNTRATSAHSRCSSAPRHRRRASTITRAKSTPPSSPMPSTTPR